MKYHLIGDMGVSMSALAELLKFQGNTVTGSDLKRNGHSRDNITKDIDFVVRNSAITDGSPGWVEVQEANRLGINIIKRSELIGKITKDKKLIAISGMHGKTTTTSLLGFVMRQAGLDPTVLVGEKVRDFNNKSYLIGKSKYFVLEACEYDKSFLDFYPEMLILTNIDKEHLDTYPGGIDEIKKTFIKYLQNVRPNGTIIANIEDKNIADVVTRANLKNINIVWYGKGSEKYQKLDVKLALFGEHNKLNALSVRAASDLLSVDLNSLKKSFSVFKGAKRRMESWGVLNNALLYDDYGHHPSEIKATINALKEEYIDRDIIVVFWPHQYKRIAPLIHEFSECFEGADKVYVKDIYFVPGRDEKLNVSSALLSEKIKKNGIWSKQFANNTDIIKELLSETKKNALLLTIGIPPIYEVLHDLKKMEKEDGLD